MCETAKWPPPLGPKHAPPIEQSTPGFANSRVRALPHVHPRGLGSRPSSLRGLNEEFYKKSLKQKSYGTWQIKKVILHIKNLVLFASVPTGFAWVCPPRFLTRIAHRRLGLRRFPMSSDERGGLEPELSRKNVVGLFCGAAFHDVVFARVPGCDVVRLCDGRCACLSSRACSSRRKVW